MRNRTVRITALAAITAGAMNVHSTEISEGLDLGGDLRVRHESIEKEGSPSRSRQRLRARISLDAKVNETVDAKFRLASGNEDPVSSNQSFDDSFSSKSINLDRAYLQWTPALQEDMSAALLGGKMKMPLTAVKDLIWDDDLNPEGFALQAGTGPLFFNAAYFVADERSKERETTMAGAQVGGNVKLGEAKLLMGVGYYSWDAMKGYPVLVDPTTSFGNSSVADVVVEGDPETLRYAEDFGQVEGFVKLSLDVGIPLSLYGDYVVNNDAKSDQDTAYMVGLTVGKAKDPGSYQFDYNFRSVEADAVVGAFTDSDSFGGGSNGEGSKLQAKYQMAENWQLAASYFINELGIAPGETSKDYERLQLDIAAKF